MISNFGLLYVATGEKHSLEAISNIQRSRPHLDGFPYCLITDKIRGNEHEHFDIVRIHDSPIFGYRDKISALQDLPFDVTLFVDSDAFLISSVSSIFQLSFISEFSAAHAPVRHPPGWSESDVPSMFPEFNSGVMLLKKCTRISNLMHDWLSTYDYLYDHFQQNWDQASLRSVVWKSILNNDLSIVVLPSEANLRTTKPWIAGRGLPVSIVHGRFDGSELEPLIRFLNSDVDCFRTWVDWLKLYPSSSIRPRFDRTYP